MRTIFYRILFLIWGSSACFLHAQYYDFQKLSPEDGLRVPLVNKVYQDHSDNFWMATMGDGLLWWNGAQFVRPFASNALDNDFVIDLIFWRDTIYLITEESFVKYDGKKFSIYPLPQSDRFVRLRSSADGVFMLGHRSGLWRWHHDSFENIIGSDTLDGWRDFLFAGDNYWLAGNSGLFHFSPSGEIIQRHLPDRNVRRLIYNNAKGGVFAGTTDGLFLVQNERVLSILRNVEVRDIVVNDEVLWVGTDGKGIWRGNEQGIGLWIAKDQGLSNNRIRSLRFDKLDRLWITTTDGVLLLSSRYTSIDKRMGGDLYTGLRASKTGDLWVCGAEGLFRFADNTWLKIDDLPAGVVLSMIEDNDGNICIGGEFGLLIYSAEGTKRCHWKDNLPDPFVTSILDDENSLLIGTASGILRLEKRYTGNPSYKVLYQEGVSSLKMHAGELYALTYASGILVFKDSELVRTINTFNGVQSSEVFINAISFDKFNRLWVATDNRGGLMFDGQTWSKVFDDEQAVYSWYHSKSGDVFAVMEDEVRIVSSEKFGEEVKLSWFTSFSLGRNARTFPFADDGRVIFFTGTDGVLSVELPETLEDPKVLIAGIYRMDLYFDVHTAWVEKAQTVHNFSGVPSLVNLHHRENYLRFAFGAVNAPLKNAGVDFRYRMRQLDPEWIYPSNLVEAVYTNLAPGRYTFEVEVRYLGSPWTSGNSIDIVIKAPWYQTWWFYIFLVIASVSLVVGVVQYRSRQAEERARLEKAVLENERSAMRSQINPHFLFNALESIGSFVMKNDVKSTMKYLNSFTKLMRLTLEAGGDTGHPVESEIALLRSYVELEQLRFGHKFEVEFEVDEEIDYDISIPPMLVQVHVENAILHGLRHLETRKGLLQIRFKILDERLVVEVEDNGVGRSFHNQAQKKKGHRSMALEINRRRMELLSKSFGHDFSLNISDLYDGEANSSGTKVSISLPIIYLDSL
ncbi:MAG: hypothetical protein EA358_10815 [Flavobacteriales bacterium]|nr:MAG: hypothetical protein EA358_10815 [Flavobacteriales bacterium]